MAQIGLSRSVAVTPPICKCRRMRSLIMIAASLLMGGASSPQAEPATSRGYGALGTEPFWNIDIFDGRIAYDTPDDRFSVPAPQPIPTPTGRRYVTERLTVDIRAQVCNDGMSDNLFADTVLLVVDDRVLYGCGGGHVAEDTLAHSSWLIDQIDDEPITDDDYTLDFSADRMGGRAGCGYFSAPWSRSGTTLTFGPFVADMYVCPEEEGQAERERRAREVLSVPLRISVEGNGRLLLSGARGSLRLTRGFGPLPTL